MDKIFKIKKKQDSRNSGYWKFKMADRGQDCTKKGFAPMFGCPLYIHNTKKACFVKLRGCPYAPIHLDAPCMFECPPVCLDTPCLYSPQCLDAPYVWTPLCMVGCPHIFGHPLYVWMPSICLAAPLYVAKCMVASKGMRDIQTYGGVQTYRGIQTYGGIQMYGGIWTPPSV